MELITRGRHAGRRMLRRAKYALGDHELFLPVLIRLTPEGAKKAIGRDTELVVEGFPRSGNTFAAVALRMAQHRPVVVATHVHHPAQVKAAVRRGLPVLLVVREPIATLASYLAYSPHGRPRGVLREYARYHRALLPYLDAVVVATFDEITTDFSVTIRRVNDRFGTAFEAFAHTPANVEAAFRVIESGHARDHPRLPVEQVVPRPSSERAAHRDALVSALEAPALAPLRDEARRLYVACVASIGRPAAPRAAGT